MLGVDSDRQRSRARPRARTSGSGEAPSPLVRTAHCPVCGGFCEVGTRGQLLDHFYGSLTCAGSGEQVADPLNPSDQVLTLIKAIVRALTADSGRSGNCESEEELLKRLDQDGAIYDPQDLPTALSPYKVLRPIPDNWQGLTARPFVLKYLRPY
jgi:hypothetical protein